jgi:hypothetical protein
MFSSSRKWGGADHNLESFGIGCPVQYTVSIYVEKTGPGNFLPYAFLMAMGHQNDPPLMSERTVPR